MKSAFDKIAAGLEDAIAYSSGDASRGREATVDVKAIREASKMTQAAFAETFRLKLGAVRDWEQGRRRPDTGSVTLLKMIAADPGAVRKIIAKV
ncbi:MAG TPA: helix-turn-helix domain-containing protein [Allosphingosinicella sp.]|nr:helix-turn-helix domain-containing protein [Allosphingosinicella sp.]